MTWDVGKGKVLRTEQLDRRAFEERVVVFTHEPGVFYRQQSLS